MLRKSPKVKGWEVRNKGNVFLENFRNVRERRVSVQYKWVLLLQSYELTFKQVSTNRNDSMRQAIFSETWFIILALQIFFILG